MKDFKKRREDFFHRPPHLGGVPMVEQLLRLILVLSLIGICLLLFVFPGMSQNSIYLGDDPGNPNYCSCLNNATNLGNGQFSDLINIEAPPGQTWTIATVSGLYNTISPAPPLPPIPLTGGTPIPEVQPGKYQITGVHIDELGFDISFTNNLGESLEIGNTCYYPEPELLLPDEVCMSSQAFLLEADNGGVSGSGSFTINGNPATFFDPAILGPGTHFVAYTFDAGDASPNDPNDPGCITTVSKNVPIQQVPNIVVNSQVNVSLGQNCSATIIPDMVLEGTYPCINTDYIVTVYDPQNNPIGDVVTGEFVGETLLVEVSTQAGNYSGNGSIFIFDGISPQLNCPDNTSLGTITKNLQLLNGMLSPGDATFTPSDFVCFEEVVDDSGNPHYYDIWTFSVNASGVYTFELDADFGRGAGTIYHGDFNDGGNGPCFNLMGISRDVDPGEGYFTNMNDIVRITLPLEQGESYTLLTTSEMEAQTGDYQWAVYSELGGTIIGVPQASGTVVLDLLCSDVDVLANAPAGPDYTGYPTVIENCADYDVDFTDAVINNGACNNTIINRTFTITDQSGNEDQCTQQISIPKPSLDDIWLPPKTYVISCDETYPAHTNGNPHPSVTGYPYVMSAFGTFELTPTYCNLLASFSDQPGVQVCEGTFQFVRRWFLFDDCSPGETVTYEQLIRIGDVEEPVVECPAPDTDGDGQPDTLFFPVDDDPGCTATLEAPLPNITDNCSGWQVLTEVVTDQIVPITNPFGQVIGQDTVDLVLATIPDGAPNRYVSGLPAGCHRFRFTVTDACNNVTVEECEFCIQDLSEPTAVCDDNLFVSLGGNGIGNLFAVDVDEGSTDNCAVDYFEIRKLVTKDPSTCEDVTPYYTDWGEYVQFNCCEVNMMITVELKVVDVSGNENTCFTDIYVKDTSKPICMAPDPVDINCGSLPPGFDPTNSDMLADLFGTAESDDNCNNAIILELTPTVNIDNCGEGTILRRFKAQDMQGNMSVNSCQQLITISEYYNYDIKFPRDVQMTCGGPTLVDTMEVFSQGCESFAINVTDNYFTTDDASCYKIFRTYHVIDWCEYNGTDDPVEVSRDEDCDGNSGDEEVWLLRRVTASYIDRDNNENNNVPPFSTKNIVCDGTTNPAGYWRTTSSVGYWTYTQVIKVFDNAPPDIDFTPPEPFCTISNNNCNGAIAYHFSVEDACQPPIPVAGLNPLDVRVFFDDGGDGTNDIEITGSAIFGTYPNYTISGQFPIGSHAFQVVVNDACGNSNSRTLPFEIVDCHIPAPVCTFGLSFELSPVPPGTDADGDGDVDAGAVTLMPTDFIGSQPLNDCSAPLVYSINKVGEMPDISQEAIVLTCDDLGTVFVEVHVWDHTENPYSVQPNGTVGGPNHDFCQTFVTIQDNLFNLCQGQVPSASIAGFIMTEEEEPVEGVVLSPNDIPDTIMMSEPNGHYQISGLNMGFDYSITPHMDGDYLNGVSTIDMILVSKHILGVQELDSPYKIIAADVNNSESITTLDVIMLRKLVLGIISELPQNASWRFVDAYYEFPDPADPWMEDFPELINVENLEYDMDEQNFVAVKIGDVNGNAQTSSFLGLEERTSNGTLIVMTEDKKVKPGETYTLHFTSTGLKDLQGYQFTLIMDPKVIELVDIRHSGQTKDENFGHSMISEGKLTSSWFTNDPDDLQGNSLFSLTLKAKTEGWLSDVFSINSEVTTAEAYNWAGQKLGVILDFRAGTYGYFPQTNSAELYQNKPNPFDNETVIGFKIPRPSGVTLSIHDISGRNIKVIEGAYESGYHEVTVRKSDFPQSGLYYYTLETEDYTETRKMILKE